MTAGYPAVVINCVESRTSNDHCSPGSRSTGILNTDSESVFHEESVF